MAGCTTLIYIGGGLEIVGFVLLIFQLIRVQRREFGWPPALVAALREVQTVTRTLIDVARGAPIEKRIGTTTEASGAGNVTSKGYGTVTTANPTLEERVAALEKSVTTAYTLITEAAKASEARANSIEAKLDDVHADLASDIDRLDRSRKDDLRASIKVELAASLIFVVGVVASVLGNVVHC